MIRRLLLITTLITFCLVVLGAYVRLADAGLGCPDWPGCYGQLTPHHAKEDILEAHAADPHGPVSMPQAWKEMVHRYIAMLVGFLILVIAALAWRAAARREQSPWLPTILLGVVILQGLFGKWTVTMLLKPAIVTGHLIGGLTTLALLTWLCLRYLAPRMTAWDVEKGVRRAAVVGFVLLGVQIALGGWVSTNYAALACTDFPTCQGSLVPQMEFAHAFHIFRDLGETADGQMLPLPALTAIHWVHRVGALIVATFLLLFAARLMRAPGMRALGIWLAALVSVQCLLGVANVWFSLPLALAAAHNAGAAALVMLMVVINFRARQGLNATFVGGLSR
ncbi:MAG: hypothetical protein RIR70_134 [Pseudomonadota bacterium]